MHPYQISMSVLMITLAVTTPASTHQGHTLVVVEMALCWMKISTIVVVCNYCTLCVFPIALSSLICIYMNG